MTKSFLTDKQLKTIQAWLGSGSINIFGLPFAGKDTHGRVLSELFKAPLLGGGDILRNSEIPPHVKSIIDSGQLAPTDDYVRIVLPYLSRKEFANKPLILSSVGRWSGEEQGVMQATEASGHETRAVVYLQLNQQTAKKRRAASKTLGDRHNRVDDSEEALNTRIDEFNSKTKPVIEAYRAMDLLIEVNSEADRDSVLKSILARLYALASASVDDK